MVPALRGDDDGDELGAPWDGDARVAEGLGASDVVERSRAPPAFEDERGTVLAAATPVGVFPGTLGAGAAVVRALAPTVGAQDGVGVGAMLGDTLAVGLGVGLPLGVGQGVALGLSVGPGLADWLAVGLGLEH